MCGVGGEWVHRNITLGFTVVKNCSLCNFLQVLRCESNLQLGILGWSDINLGIFDTFQLILRLLQVSIKYLRGYYVPLFRY